MTIKARQDFLSVNTKDGKTKLRPVLSDYVMRRSYRMRRMHNQAAELNADIASIMVAGGQA